MTYYLVSKLCTPGGHCERVRCLTALAEEITQGGDDVHQPHGEKAERDGSRGAEGVEIIQEVLRSSTVTAAGGDDAADIPPWSPAAA